MLLFFVKQKTAYELRISDWSSDVCSSDLQRQRDDRLIRRLRFWMRDQPFQDRADIGRVIALRADREQRARILRHRMILDRVHQIAVRLDDDAEDAERALEIRDAQATGLRCRIAPAVGLN